MLKVLWFTVSFNDYARIIINYLSNKFLSVIMFWRCEILEISEEASTSSTANTAILNGEVKSARGARLKLYQFGSLFVKRFHHHRRDIRSYFSQLFLPVIFMCLAMACSLIKPSPHDLPSTLLAPSMYGPGTTMFFRYRNK